MPKGPPRRPLPATAAALELPTEDDPLAYPTETDAVGTALLDEPPPELPPARPRRRFPWRRAA